MIKTLGSLDQVCPGRTLVESICTGELIELSLLSAIELPQDQPLVIHEKTASLVRC